MVRPEDKPDKPVSDAPQIEHERPHTLAEAHLLALERLPADYREVLILRHMQELSFTEVARHMGRTVDSVKKLWARALPRLRDVLEDAP